MTTKKAPPAAAAGAATSSETNTTSDATGVSHDIAQNAREYFERCQRHGGTPATIDDLCGVLEYFGVTPTPAGHAPSPHAK